MKAVIMAGGEGARLRPLTCDLPKPMARLCGRPVLEYILELLSRHGFTEAAVTVRYLPDAITGHFAEGRYGNINLTFVEENRPLGTAGSVKNACAPGEEVLVISGDALCDFDLSAAMAYHHETNADVTILAKKVDDPREYGLIDSHEDGRIAAFIEKPAFSQAISDLANTGIYILSPEALARIPDDTFFDFAKDLFPALLGDGRKLMCKEDTGYWCDIGDLGTYIQCQRDMLAGKVRCDIRGERDEQGNIFAGERPPRHCTVAAPSYFGVDVTVEEGVSVEGSIIDDGCYIGRDARVSGSIVLPGAYLSQRARLTGAIICAGASVKTGVMLFEGATVGAGAVIGERSTVNAGVKIWNKKRIPVATVVREHVKISTTGRSYFGEEGITGEIGVELTPEFMARLGAAVGSVMPEARIAVGGSTHQGVVMLKEALIAGILSTGARVLNFGESFLARFQFDVDFSTAPLAVFVTGGRKAGVRVLGLGGLPADRDTERSIETMLARGEVTRCPAERLGDKVDMNGMEMLYKSQLIRHAIRGLSGVAAQVRSRNMVVQDTLRDTLYKLGCDVSDGFTLEVSSQGDKVRILDSELGYIPHHRILAWCAMSRMERGEDVALPFDAPRFLDEIAQRQNVKLYRYYDCPADTSDREARKVAAYQMWSRDGLMQAVMLLSLIREEGSIRRLPERYADFGMATATLETAGSPAGLIRAINSQKTGTVREGIVITHDRGVVLVKPLKKGTGIKILAEAVNAEIAREICADVEKSLRDRMQDE